MTEPWRPRHERTRDQRLDRMIRLVEGLCVVTTLAAIAAIINLAHVVGLF